MVSSHNRGTSWSTQMAVRWATPTERYGEHRWRGRNGQPRQHQCFTLPAHLLTAGYQVKGEQDVDPSRASSWQALSNQAAYQDRQAGGSNNVPPLGFDQPIGGGIIAGGASTIAGRSSSACGM